MCDFSKIPQIISPNSRILLSPLDWGLGHASRMIPLIGRLQRELSCEITIAANGPQRALIAEIYPQIPFLAIPDYGINYHKNRAATIASLALSLPRIQGAIKQEAAWLKRILKKLNFNVIISDNRYGLSHQTISSIFITHQLRPKTPFGRSADSVLQQLLYRLINQFTECWIPDYAEEPSLSGELSHPTRLPAIPVRYIGPLTRIQPMPATGKPIRLLAILSGPEPQRTILEKIILGQWTDGTDRRDQSLVLVRGLPGDQSIPKPVQPSLTIHNHLSAADLSQAIADAQTIVCRSGYSSLMDLLLLEKDLVMVPTPGQTEQEYLARLHAAKGNIRMFLQQDFSLSKILK